LVHEINLACLTKCQIYRTHKEAQTCTFLAFKEQQCLKYISVYLIRVPNENESKYRPKPKGIRGVKKLKISSSKTISASQEQQKKELG
jgi:hypothetical protein